MGLHFEGDFFWFAGGKLTMTEKKHLLFVCVENSCRSQMAEAFALSCAGDMIEVYSAGSRPSRQVNPGAIAVMREIGYDLKLHHSKSFNDIPQGKYDYIITMGCGDECPFIPAEYHEEWDIPDPKDMPIEEFRKVRDLIERRVEELVVKIKKHEEI
jgi:protein-tyrosine-phosphatase